MRTTDPTTVAVGAVARGSPAPVGPDAGFAEIAATMRRTGLPYVLVVADDGPRWGAVSDLDLADALTAGDDVRAGRLASGQQDVLRADQALDEAVEALVADGAEHRLVVDGAGLPCGVADLLDLVEVLALQESPR